MCLIFVPFIIIACCGLAYTLYNWRKRYENWVVSFMFAVFISSIVCILLLGMTAIIENDHNSVTKYYDINKTKYDLLQYKINEFNNADNEEKVHILLNDTLLEDIDKWNNEKAEYEKLQNNVWIGFLCPDTYKDMDYISLLEE